MIHSNIRENDEWVIADNGVQDLRIDKRSGKAKAFNRVSVTNGKKRRYLVGELDGVKVYIDGNKILMTKQEIYP